MAFRGDILLDDTLWPLLLVRFQGMPSVQQFQSYLEWMTEHLERRQPYVCILDSSGVVGTGPTEHRQMQAAWMKKHDARIRELDRGTALVITSPLVQLALNVVFHLHPMPSPHRVTTSLAEAAAWTAARLEEDGQRAAAQRVRERFMPQPLAG